jgi:hypothetical protein
MTNFDSVDKAVLDLYTQKIENYALNDISEDFFNSGSEHALIVLKTIAKYARSTIKVLAGNLCTYISSDPEYIKNLRTFLINGGKMQVLLCDYDNGYDHFNKDIFKLFMDFRSNVELKKTSNRLEIKSGNTVHFTVADSKMYRLETDVINKIARGNFNDRKNSTILEEIFNKVFNSNSSSAISIP